MAMESTIDKTLENKDVFTVNFTNGTVQQLRELADYLEKEGLITDKSEEKDRLESVVRIGIAWLESVKSKDSAK